MEAEWSCVTTCLSNSPRVLCMYVVVSMVISSRTQGFPPQGGRERERERERGGREGGEGPTVLAIVFILGFMHAVYDVIVCA